MKGSHIIVSGSSSGIGKSVSEFLLKKGATVIGLSRTQRNFVPKSDRYSWYRCDVSDLKKLSAVFAKILTDNPRIDGFISNAGFGQFKGFENFSTPQIISYLNANLLSHMLMTRALIPVMKKQKKGKIIFIGSESAIKGGQQGSVYSAAKFGLRGFTQAVREECAKSKVHISIVNPGMVRTEFFDKLSFVPGDNTSNAIEPEDVAEVVFSILKMREGTVIDEINLSPLNKVIKFKKDQY